jgi:hypothetical protein
LLRAQLVTASAREQVRNTQYFGKFGFEIVLLTIQQQFVCCFWYFWYFLQEAQAFAQRLEKEVSLAGHLSNHSQLTDILQVNHR